MLLDVVNERTRLKSNTFDFHVKSIADDTPQDVRVNHRRYEEDRGFTARMVSYLLAALMSEDVAAANE